MPERDEERDDAASGAPRADDARDAEARAPDLASDDTVELDIGSDDTVHASPEDHEPRPGRARFVTVAPGTRLGRYLIRDELGAGGMATVFLAHDTQLRRDVAVKVLFPHLCKRREIVARFQREARAAAALDHDNILRVFDVGGNQVKASGPGGDDSTIEDTENAESGDLLIEPPYIVMELVRGRSLDVFTREQADSFTPLAEIVACVGVLMCAALERAHQAGIVHRDVKPGNIMVSEDGRVALTDFGVARIEDEDSSLVTRTGALLGTPAFMSPEQTVGADLDARSDIYSLGATLYHLATGSTPFSGPTARVVSAISSGRLDPPIMRNPRIGRELSRVIERMMARDPDQRYQRCDHAREALLAIVASAGLKSPEHELRAFFAEPAAYQETHTPAVARASLERAREAVRGRSLAIALAHCDRVLALVPESDEARAAMDLVDRIGRGRTLRWAMVAVALVVVAALVWLGARWFASPSTPADAPVSDQDAGLDAPVADPSGATWPPIVHISGDASVPLADASPDARPSSPGDGPRPRSNGKRPRPDAGLPGPAPVDAGPRPVDAAPRLPLVIDARPAEPARLFVAIRPWCDVYIDDTPHGRASANRAIELAPGTYEVVCTQGPGRARFSQSVTLRAGEKRTVRHDLLAPVQVEIALSKSGYRLQIGDTIHDNGARIELAPARYRITVLSGDKVVVRDWISLPAVASCTLRDRPALDCYR